MFDRLDKKWERGRSDWVDELTDHSPLNLWLWRGRSSKKSESVRQFQQFNLLLVLPPQTGV
jgi:hypothetical protein